MKLEEGKYYEALNGSVWGPIQYHRDGYYYANGCEWGIDGIPKWPHCDSDYDLELAHKVEKPKRIEPTYEQRQAEWLEEHGLKVGDKVKIWRAFNGPPGWHDGTEACLGRVGTITAIDNWIEVQVDSDYNWSWPYSSLEPYKEPPCRPSTFEEAR